MRCAYVCVCVCVWGVGDFVFFMYIFLLFLSGDLLENYCWNDDLMNFSRVLFSVSILLTFPIECFVSREVSRTTLLSGEKFLYWH